MKKLKQKVSEILSNDKIKVKSHAIKEAIDNSFNDIQKEHMGELLKIEKLTEPHDILWEKIERLAFELNTIKWKERKSTGVDAWDLAVDNIRKELITILHSGRE